MNKQMIEEITRVVMEKIEEKASGKRSYPGEMVKIWDHLSPKPRVETDITFEEVPLITNNQSEEILSEPITRAGVKHPHDPEALTALRSKTPARIGVGRAGVRAKTEAWLKFRLDHAAAVDAVYGEVLPHLLEKHNVFTVHTLVKDKEEYIRRPDLGRRLSKEAKKLIKEKCIFEPQVQVVVSNGLSAEAIEQNFEDTFLSFQQSLDQLGLKQGTPFYIDKGRVAVMDDIGELLQPEVVVLLIGERPGLISAESLSAYMCYKPRRGTVEAERMVISNIHSGGIPPVEAGAYLGSLIQKILEFKASGVSLVEKES